MPSVTHLLDAHERDLSTAALLAEVESLSFDLAEVDEDPDGWSFVGQTRAHIGCRLESLATELARRDRLRHHASAPPWPDIWPDAASVKRAVRLEDIVETYAPVPLERVGQELRCACPFPDHDDGTPSFYVHPGKQLFLCRGCLRGGSAIDFIAMYLDLSFVAALDFLRVVAAPAETGVR